MPPDVTFRRAYHSFILFAKEFEAPGNLSCFMSLRSARLMSKKPQYARRRIQYIEGRQSSIPSSRRRSVPPQEAMKFCFPAVLVVVASWAFAFVFSGLLRPVDGFSVVFMARRKGQGNLVQSLDNSDSGGSKGVASVNRGKGQEITGVTLPEEVRLFALGMRVWNPLKTTLSGAQGRTPGKTATAALPFQAEPLIQSILTRFLVFLTSRPSFPPSRCCRCCTIGQNQGLGVWRRRPRGVQQCGRTVLCDSGRMPAVCL